MNHKRKSRWRPALAILLALALALPLSVAPVMAAEDQYVSERAQQPSSLSMNSPTLEVMGNEIISMTDRGEYHVVLTIDKNELDQYLDAHDTTASDWYQTLTWSLTRDKGQSPQDSKLYPHVYTGDLLQNWQRWAGGGSFFIDLEAKLVTSSTDIDADGEVLEEKIVEDKPSEEPVAEEEEATLDVPEINELETPKPLPEVPEIVEPEEPTLVEPKIPEVIHPEEPEPVAPQERTLVDDPLEIVAAKDEYLGDPVQASDLADEEYLLTNEGVHHQVVFSDDMDEDVVRVELTFKNKLFFGGTSEADTVHNFRNVFGSFVGEYQLSVEDGMEISETTPMYLTIYPGYRLYSETYEELGKIADAAEANGRYLTIKEYGISEAGYTQYAVIFAKSSDAVDNFTAMNQRAQTDPRGLQTDIKSGAIADYQVPLMINNIHPDENPGVDAQLNFLWKLATEDSISYSSLTGLTVQGESLKEDRYVTSTIKEWATDLGRVGGAQGEALLADIYTMEDVHLDVDQVLDELIFVLSPNENPDGRTYNSRRNANGFDLNRDTTFQTQAETRNIAKLINQWNPISLVELHGFVNYFLIEPCTPPHESNQEYDLMLEHLYKGGEAYGNAALASLSDQYYSADGSANIYSRYVIPLRDYFDRKSTNNKDKEKPWKWEAWDDLSTNYTPQYAMITSNSLGYTIETPYSNLGSTDLLEYGMYGLTDYLANNKADIYNNQLEFFARGIENYDEEGIRDYYVDIEDKKLENPDIWRPRYEENNSFFPEYWVIPVDAENQRNPAAAYDMEEFLLHNDIKVEELTADVKVGETTYKAGTIIVNMHQAKRNYANAVLWDGVDASDFNGLYSEVVVSFPHLRGFQCTPVLEKDAFDGVSKRVISRTDAGSLFSGISGKGVVIMNNGLAATQAVNDLLAEGIEVGLITGGEYKGNFIVADQGFQTVSNKYVLVAIGIEVMPEAYVIKEPSVYLAGRYEDFSNAKVTDGYYADYFSDGYGFINYQNVHSNATSNFDVMAYKKQMGFRIVEDPGEADVIVGSVPLNQGTYGTKALAEVKGGKPYIAHGTSPLSIIKSQLLTSGFDYKTESGETLHYVTYPNDSVITAAREAMGDNVLYNYGAGYITQVPEDATVLIQAEEEDFHIAGCYYKVNDNKIGGQVEAIDYVTDKLNMTIFATSIVNKAHQQDDYGYAATAIYSKVLGDKMEIESMGGGKTGQNIVQYLAKTLQMNIEKNQSFVVGHVLNIENPEEINLIVMELSYDKDQFDYAGTVILDDRLHIIDSDEYEDDVLVIGTYGDERITKDGLVALFETQFKIKAGKQPAESIVTIGKIELHGGNPTTKLDYTMGNDKVKTTLIYSDQSGSNGGKSGSRNKDDKVEDEKQPLPPSSETGQFTDVSASVWYHDAVSYVVGKGFFAGTSNTQFSPDIPMTRAMFVTVLGRMAEQSGYKTSGYTASFADVQPGTWYADYVGWAAANGIVSGYDASRFGPDEQITREQIAAIFVRFAVYAKAELRTSQSVHFSDEAQISNWAKDSVTKAASAGLINGYDDGTFKPIKTATRAEVASILKKFHESYMTQ